jgi:excisionase family DNA binding protein
MAEKNAVSGDLTPEEEAVVVQMIGSRRSLYQTAAGLIARLRTRIDRRNAAIKSLAKKVVLYKKALNAARKGGLAATQSDRLLTADEAADYLGLAKQTLAAWRMTGKGPSAIKLGRSIRYKLSTINAWLAQNMLGDAR